MKQSNAPTPASGTFLLGGDIPIYRLGFGAMRITGDGIWGPPADPEECLRVLRRAVELGVNFIDTADSYGPNVSEELIRQALHPYDGVTIATKAGFLRTGPGAWVENCDPKRLRQAAEGSLRRLGVETIDLYQLHRIDPNFPLEDQIGVFKQLQEEGKVRHIGLSEVTVEQIEACRKIADIVSVQNLYNVGERRWEDVLDYCQAEGIGFIPWYPVAVGKLAKPGGVLASVAGEVGATPIQVSLAWLLARAEVMLPIPGTSSVAHLEENQAAATVRLSQEQFDRIDRAHGTTQPLPDEAEPA
ncbi:MAG TPA: aldo/keto reductase [Actinomycetota bacterium]|nr:aldo/keto reductase [Actinomycetota bacterium]